jgi:hypothetical protein
MGMSDARSTGSVSGISNSFDIEKKVEIDLNYSPRTARFIAEVSLISVYCSSLSTSPKADNITIKISEDADCDRYVLTSTQTDLEYGETTATKATGMIKMEVTIALEKADTVYVLVKTNQGTLTIDEVVITYDDGKK